MNINKGYILPVVLIVLLLVCAGFVLFAPKAAVSPVITPPIQDVATSTDDIDSVSDIDDEDTTSTTTDAIDDTQATTSTATDLEE
jgi:hypothetical protein